MEISLEKRDHMLRFHACQRARTVTFRLMWDLILPSSDKCVCQYDSAGRLGLIVLLFMTILTARWRTSHAVWLCRKVEDFANVGTRGLKGVWKLVRNPSYENVDRERGSAECKSAAVSTVLLFGGKFGMMYFS